jgi:hypothetical protein
VIFQNLYYLTLLEVLYFLLLIPSHFFFPRKRISENFKGVDHPEDLGANMGVNFKDAGFEVVDSIHLAQNRVQWWTIMNTVMNLYVI